MPVRWEPEPIELSEEARNKICQVFLRFVRENGKLGLRADGGPLPAGVDLVRTGAMLFGKVRISGGKLTFLTPYAEITNKMWNWLGIPPQRTEEFLQAIEPIVQEGLSFKRS